MPPDPKAVRRYQASVERALGTFDTSNEWADYIAYLGRLVKALQSSPGETDIPAKATVARQLAQCLQPSLPSGVHQKALEVYACIFSLIGKEGLARDLAIYFPGVSHALAFASLTTRPFVLTLYDDYILKSPTRALRPALKAIILSLLPGIEEETGEDFERTLDTFNTIRKAFGDQGSESVFWQDLFLASVTSAGRRAGVLVYLARYLPKLGASPTLLNGSDVAASDTPDLVQQIQNVTTPEPGLLIRCFATGLRDENSLIQREFLDLLVTHLPLSTAFLHIESSRGDLEILIYAATTVTLRRDMSLNRRLWSWFLGHDSKTASAEIPPGTPLASPLQEQSDEATQMTELKEVTYFRQHALQPLIETTRRSIEVQELESARRARPFRIMASLADRWEVGAPVVEQLFVPMIRNLKQYQTTASSQSAFDEVFRSANVFFDGVESKMIWSQIFRLFTEDDFELVNFVLDNFSLQEEEMMRIHAPLLCLVVIQASLRSISMIAGSETTTAIVPKVTHQAMILDKLSSLVTLSSRTISTSVKDVSYDKCVSQIAAYYAVGQQSGRSSQTPLSSDELSHLLPKASTELLVQTMESILSVDLLRTYSSVHRKACACSSNIMAIIRELDVFRRLKQVLQLPDQEPHQRFSVAFAATSAIASVQSLVGNEQKEEFYRGLIEVVPTIVANFWEIMIPRYSQFVVETVESLWTLQALSLDLQLVESTIMSQIVRFPADGSNPDGTAQRFATLWSHSHSRGSSTSSIQIENGTNDKDVVMNLLTRPLLFILDQLETNQGEEWKDWLSSLSSSDTVFTVVLNEMSDSTTARQDVLVNIRRLQHLIAIAGQSNAQSKNLKSNQDLNRNLWNKVLKVAKLPSTDDIIAVRSLGLMRTMLQNSALTPPSDLMMILLERLDQSYGLMKTENALLDCLQAAIAVSETLPSSKEILPKLLRGISSMKVDTNLDKWITILCNILPQYSTVVFFPNLLKITERLCKRIKVYHDKLNQSSRNSPDSAKDASEQPSAANPERSITNLLAGLEYILARSHQLLTAKSEDSRNGAEDIKQQTATVRSYSNNRLTVILCMQDAVRICEQIWSWRSTLSTGTTGTESKSLHQLASRLRARSRRILENLIDVEPQECLETLMGMWTNAVKEQRRTDTIMTLLQTLDGARPKFMMPAVFNAVYNRTSPSSLDQSQRSTMSIVIGTPELTAFLLEYSRSLEDDLLEEIWADCTTFIREVLANPLPHRQILLPLLQFIAILYKKMENTNFGEESRMRRELAELCARLFTAIFTVKPGGLDQANSISGQKASDDRSLTTISSKLDAQSAVRVIWETLPILSTMLADAGRLADVYTGLSINITGPRLKSKMFPRNLTLDILKLLQIMSKASSAQKAWKRDIVESFNDVKFFQCSSELVKAGWMPLLQQLSTDKSFMPELIGRLTAPTTAGLVFGVGASAARNIADKSTSSNVRRVAITLLSAEVDSFVVNLPQLRIKIEELFSATAESSPSSLIKADLYMLLRAMVLSFSQQQLISFWSAIETELRNLFTDMTAEDKSFSAPSSLQGAKLLDLLLILKLEEFQLHEWLFVTDTVDAIYPDSTSPPNALADRIAAGPSMDFDALQKKESSGKRRPWLCHDVTRSLRHPEALLKSFFSQLSIHAFEDAYSLEEIDLVACRCDLLADLFSDETVLEDRH